MGSGVPARVWSGDEWQEYVLLLLKRHHGPANFQEIPDKDRGDCGLEGFSRDGNAYQCYAAEEPLSVTELTAKQKTKVTKDIKKFRDNATKLVGLLGATKITTWILVVPRFDSKDLLAHTAKKEKEVRGAGLPHVCSCFAINVIKDDHFAVERMALFDSGLGKVGLEVIDSPDKEVQEWAGKHDLLVKTIDKKLGNLSAVPQANRKPLRDQFLRHYVTGQNLLDRLRIDYPPLYEKVRACQRNRERSLATLSMLKQLTLEGVLQQFRGELDRDAKGLSESNAECLAWGAVADWLLRCPLDFPKG